MSGSVQQISAALTTLESTYGPFTRVDLKRILCAVAPDLSEQVVARLVNSTMQNAHGHISVGPFLDVLYHDFNEDEYEEPPAVANASMRNDDLSAAVKPASTGGAFPKIGQWCKRNARDIDNRENRFDKLELLDQSQYSSKTPAPPSQVDNTVPETLRYGPRELRHLQHLRYNVDGCALSAACASTSKLPQSTRAANSREVSSCVERSTMSEASTASNASGAHDSDSFDSDTLSRTLVPDKAVPKTLRYGPRELRHLKALGYTVDGIMS